MVGYPGSSFIAMKGHGLGEAQGLSLVSGMGLTKGRTLESGFISPRLSMRTFDSLTSGEFSQIIGH